MLVHILIAALFVAKLDEVCLSGQTTDGSTPTTIDTTTTPTTEKQPEKCDLIVDLYDRYDCHPDSPANEQQCLARGCCWDADSSDKTLSPGLKVPACYFPQDYDAYQVHKDTIGYEYKGTTRFALYNSGKTEAGSGFHQDMAQLMGYIRNFGDFVNIIIREAQTVPKDVEWPQLTFPPLLPSHELQRERHPLDYDLSNDGILTVRRSKTTGEQGLVWRANLKQLIFSRNFVQINSETGSNRFFGLGQQMGSSLRKSPNQEKRYTMFNYGSPPNENEPSQTSYPFYLNIEPPYNETGPQANGVYLHNSHPMDVILNPRPGVTWRTLGGFLDFYIFAGPTAHQVVEQYTKLVGRPALPPMWALGFHLSRNNYNSDRALKMAWARTVGRSIPLDGIWTDIDQMVRYTSFTWKSAELSEFFHRVRENDHLHHVAIVNPGISAGETPGSYRPYELAKEMDILIKLGGGTQGDEQHEGALVGLTWPESEQTVFVDYSHKKIVDYLVELLGHYEKLIDFDGLWLDMNEPEMFLDGSKSGCPVDNQLEEPQYLPGNSGRRLTSRTLCMTAKLQSGTHYELHNLYAFYQSVAFRKALKRIRPNKRPFVVSRGQFSGQGKYSANWLGDINSSFEHMQWSIIGIIQSNWYGQPMTGGDICGYFSTASDDLCARWSSLGAFYPLARNHNDAYSMDQDPGSRSEIVSNAALFALRKRYSLLPYLYTLFYQNHLFGSPVIRAISFEFFTDLVVFASSDDTIINDQFLWGQALMIAPVVQQNTTDRHVFLPPGRWFDISVGLDDKDEQEPDSLSYDFTISDASDRLLQLGQPIDVTHEQGRWILNLATPIQAINLYLRGGHILATFSRPGATIFETIKQPFTLEVALNQQQEATGELYWDSGESPEEEQSYNHVEFAAKDNQLTIKMMKDSYQRTLYFAGIIIYGLESERQIREVKLNDVTQQFSHHQQKQMLKCRLSSTGDKNEGQRLNMERHILITWS